MKQGNCSVLSIVPYRFLPPTSGGHLCIALTHHYLGLLCNDHIVSTVDNPADDKYAFYLHKVFGTGKLRYRPYYKLGELRKIAEENNINYICCDHPYMAPTAIALSKKLGLPWYMRSHNIESERFRSYGKKWWPIMRTFEKNMMQRSTGVFFITPEDAQWAMDNYALPKEKCHLAPFGTTFESAPVGHAEAKNRVAAQMGLDANKPWLYFLGALDFYPNQHALGLILDEVIPRLHKKNIPCEILVAGKGLNSELQQRITDTPDIRYAGFIPDLDDFLKANDIMLNAVLLGGGIKTKAVEALGYNKFVVSTLSASAGLQPDVCGENLLISADNDWDAYTDNIVSAINKTPAIPQAFYNTYYWGNIAGNMLSVLQAG